MRILLFSVLLGFAQVISSQTADERAAGFMNRQDWFGLKREFMANEDSLSPYIHDFSAALLDNAFNDLPAAELSIAKMLNEYQGVMDGESILSMTYSLTDVWHRMGKNKEAAGLMNDLCNQLKGTITDTTVLQSFEFLAKQYEELASIGNINEMERPEKDIVLPILIDTIKTSRTGYIIYVDGKLNGRSERFLFDTGAGVNCVSPQVANELGLRILDVATYATGVEKGTGGFAIADSMQIGEILFRNVPFYVLDMATGNVEADKYIDALRIIIGIPIIHELQEVQMDFENSRMIIPEKLTPSPFICPNLYLDGGRNLRAEVFWGQKILQMRLDTGSGTTCFYPPFYERNKEQIERVGVKDTMRSAGFGGVRKDTVYHIPDVFIQLGSSRGYLPQADVAITGSMFGNGDSDGLIGMDLFLAYSKIILNLKDMFVEGIPYLSLRNGISGDDRIVNVKDMKLNRKLPPKQNRLFAPAQKNNPTYEMRFVNDGGRITAVGVTEGTLP